MLAVAQPLGIDQSLWASAVFGLEHGQRLYVDVWEQRPPGIYLAYWAAFSVFGWTAGAIGLLDALASAITTALIHAIARLLGGRTMAAVAAALFAVLTMPAWLYRYGGFIERSISETFIMVGVGAAALCGVLLRRRASVRWAFGLGLAIGGAIVFKPNAAIYFPFILGWSLLHGDNATPPVSGFRWRVIAAAATGASIIPAMIVLWLWRIEALAEAKIAVVDFNRYYVTAGFNLPEYAVAFAQIVWLRTKTESLWAAAMVASALACVDLVRRRRLDRLASLAMAWGAAAVVVIVVNGMRLYNTYFVQALAPLTLIAAWWLTTVWTRDRWQRVVAAATLVVMAALLVQRNFIPKVAGDLAADAARLAGRTDEVTYLDRFGGYANERGYSARANAELATYVQTRTAPDDRIFLFGINGAGVYFLSQRLTAHRFLRVNFFVPDGFPDPRFTLGAVVDDLGARRPVYLIFERLHSESDMGRAVDALPDHPLIQGLLSEYDLETRIEDFTVYRRRSRTP